MRQNIILLAVAVLGVELVLADGTDWVNPRYVISTAGQSPDTAAARQSILSRASSSAKGGPWSVTSSNVTAPSGDKRDYLSWPPYHWPDCNWCKSRGPKGNAHYASHTEDPPSETAAGSHKQNEEASSNKRDNGISDESDCDASNEDMSHSASAARDNTRRDLGDLDGLEGLLTGVLPLGLGSEFGQGLNQSVLEELSSVSNPEVVNGAEAALEPLLGGVLSDTTPTPSVPLASTPTLAPISLPHTHQSSDRVASHDPSQAGAYQKTNSHTHTASEPRKTSGSNSDCTPSPTRSMAPSATWTTCPYKAYDGRVNPDVRTLHDPNAANKMSDSSLLNALAYALSGQRRYSQNAATILSTFFMQKKTMMNPNMNYTQTLRGPIRQNGAYTGIVDLRGMVKVANAVTLLRTVKSPDWTLTMDRLMVAWTALYVHWLQTSSYGKQAGSSANNHVTFYTAQLAALQILAGDISGAKSTLQTYYTGPFLEQITAQGEQPLEAVRTRPFHYRCFNIEAMIVVAKLGDYLGIDTWSSQSRYKATLQNAVDYTMDLDPGKENGQEIVPHVAAIAAAYGDPDQRYQTFISQRQDSYTRQTFWYYDQPSAFDSSPYSRDKATSLSRRDAENVRGGVFDVVPSVPSAYGLHGCPPVFKGAALLELDLGIYVSCSALRPFYAL